MAVWCSVIGINSRPTIYSVCGTIVHMTPGNNALYISFTDAV